MRRIVCTDCFSCICASSPRYLLEYLLDFLLSPKKRSSHTAKFRHLSPAARDGVAPCCWQSPAPWGLKCAPAIPAELPLRRGGTHPCKTAQFCPPALEQRPGTEPCSPTRVAADRVQSREFVLGLSSGIGTRLAEVSSAFLTPRETPWQAFCTSRMRLPQTTPNTGHDGKEYDPGERYAASNWRHSARRPPTFPPARTAYC
jgi:hypothetical protein